VRRFLAAGTKPMVHVLRIIFGLLIVALLLAPLLIWGLLPDEHATGVVAALEPWVPVYEGLVWPVFILALIAFFTPQVKDFIKGIYDAVVHQGRPIEIAQIFKLGGGRPTEGLTTPPISANDLSVADLPMEGFVEKGSRESLTRLQEQLKKGRSFNMLVLSDNHRYSRPLLREYVTTLGMRFVVFVKGQDWQFDGWIQAGLFAAQMPNLEIERRQITEGDVEDAMISYDRLKISVAGVRSDAIYDRSTPRWTH